MDVDKHISQSNHNADVNTYLDSDNSNYVDWSFTATFYEAVHYIDAYAVHVEGFCPYERHYEREQWMKGQKFPHPVFCDYSELKCRSEDARYLTHYSAFITDVERQRIRDLRNNELERIKQYLRTQGLVIP